MGSTASWPRRRSHGRSASRSGGSFRRCASPPSWFSRDTIWSATRAGSRTARRCNIYFRPFCLTNSACDTIRRDAVTTYFIWDGLNLLQELNADGTIKEEHTHVPVGIPGIGQLVESYRPAEG